MATGTTRMRGLSEHSLDEKGRVIIPQKFRDAIGEEFMLVTGPGPCLRIYPMSVFEKIEEQLESRDVLDEANSDVQKLQRLFYNGEATSLDQQNRVTLPRPLRNWAQFGKLENETVIIMGMGEKLELWSPTAWEAYNSDLTTESTTEASNRRRSALGSRAAAEPSPPENRITPREE